MFIMIRVVIVQQKNLAVEHYISDNITSINEVKQCAASCCGDEGVLLKKYEPTENILT